MKKLFVFSLCLLSFYSGCSSDKNEVNDISDSIIDVFQNITDIQNDAFLPSDSGEDSGVDDLILFDSQGNDVLNDIVLTDHLEDKELIETSFDIEELQDTLEEFDLSDISAFLDTFDRDGELSDILNGGDGGFSDAGINDNYDRLLVVSHPFGVDGASCGRDIEFFMFSEKGELIRLNERVEVGDCPIRVKFSPDGESLFVILNNSHNPQSGTQSVVVLKKNNSGKYFKVKQFDEFSMQNPEYIAFKRDGSKAFIVDFDIEGRGGIHIIKREGDEWFYQKEISIALPRSLVVLPQDKYAVVVGGKEPYDVAIMDIEDEKIISQMDIFKDFVDAFGIDVTFDGRYVIIPNSSPYSDIADTLSILEIDYTYEVPTCSLKNMVSNVNEPSDSLFTTDGRYLVVTNFSKNYSSLFEFVDGNLTLLNKVTSMPLADTMTMIRRGTYKDYFFVNALSDIHILKINNNVLTRVFKVSLGDGYNNMLGDIDIEP